jgi:hypothetical protein
MTPEDPPPPARLLAPLAIAGHAWGQSSDAPFTPVRETELSLGIEVWFDDLALPLSIALVPDRDGHWLVAQMEGRALAVHGREIAATPFLDLSRRVTALAGEQGFFSIAVEPLARAAARGRARHAVAAYTERDTGDLLVSAFPVDEATWVADAAAEIEVLRVAMPEPFHHGGQVRFGPGRLPVRERGQRRVVEPLPGGAPLERRLARDPAREAAPHRPAADGGPDPAYRVPDDNPFARELDPAVRGRSGRSASATPGSSPSTRRRAS